MLKRGKDDKMEFVKHLVKRFKKMIMLEFQRIGLFFLIIIVSAPDCFGIFIPLPTDYKRRFIWYCSWFAPEGAIALIEHTLEGMTQKNGTILSLGIIGTLWSASNGINAIVKVINRSYNVERRTSYFHKTIDDDFLTLAMMVIIIVALILPVFGKQIGVFLFSQFQLSDEFILVMNALRLLVSSVIIFVIFIGLYWLAPSKRFFCRTAIPGAAFATIGWILTSYAFSYYVENIVNYSLTYGSIGAIIILMIWFYISGIIIIIGGDVNAYFTVYKKKDC